MCANEKFAIICFSYRTKEFSWPQISESCPTLQKIITTSHVSLVQQECLFECPLYARIYMQDPGHSIPGPRSQLGGPGWRGVSRRFSFLRTFDAFSHYAYNTARLL